MRWTKTDVKKYVSANLPVNFAPGLPKINATEARYGSFLNIQKHAHIIYDYRFEPIKLRLANNTTYTPDFMVIPFSPFAKIEFHEVKGGFIREDAWIKLKIAAEIYPEFKFVLAQWKNNAWTITEVKR